MKTILISAGGTGGHIFAALSLGNQLKENGYKVVYISGTRHLDYKLFSGHENVYHLNGKPLRGTNGVQTLKYLLLNLWVFFRSIVIVLREKVSGGVGAGGYICGPSLLAVKILGKTIFGLEQNAVLGKTNKYLLPFLKNLFGQFNQLKGMPDHYSEKYILSGNPIRKDFLKYEYVNKFSSPLRILVFGGSLGSEKINDLMKNIVSENLSETVKIVHQVGKAKGFKVEKVHQGLEYTQVEFIDDMAKAMKDCDIVLARAGASTITELAFTDKPAILFPLEIHADKHQFHNAFFLREMRETPTMVFNPKEGTSYEDFFRRSISDISKWLKNDSKGNFSEKKTGTEEILRVINNYV